MIFGDQLFGLNNNDKQNSRQMALTGPSDVDGPPRKEAGFLLLLHLFLPLQVFYVICFLWFLVELGDIINCFLKFLFLCSVVFHPHF